MGLHGLLLASLNIEKKSFLDEEKNICEGKSGKGDAYVKPRQIRYGSTR
jgi:hypothetical protein